MVDLKCDHGDVNITINGDVAELGADVLTILHVMFRRIFSESTFEAMLFRTMIEDSLEEAFKLSDEEIQLEKEVNHE